MGSNLCRVGVVGLIRRLLCAAVALSGSLVAYEQPQLHDNTPVLGMGTAQVGQVFSLPPNPGAPFTATVEFEATQLLSDRTIVTHKSTSSVARDSKGRTRNELRVLVDGPNGQEPETLQVILFDPGTKVRTTLSPKTHTAVQAIAKVSTGDVAPSPIAAGTSKASRAAVARPPQAEQIGMDYMNGLQVKHFRERRRVTFGESGNESEVETVYEYWYSPDLKVNLLSKHNDPRTGSQAATLKNIHRGEPNSSLFEIPKDYRIIAADAQRKTNP
jgi:hypothetical protein